jgi:hypothetical protein
MKSRGRRIGVIASLSIFSVLALVIFILLDCYDVDHPVIGLSTEAWSALFGIHTGLQILYGILLAASYRHPSSSSSSKKEITSVDEWRIYNFESLRIFVAYVLGGTLLFTIFIFIPVLVTNSSNLARVRDYLVIFFSWSLPAFTLYGFFIKSWWKIYS